MIKTKNIIDPNDSNRKLIFWQNTETIAKLTVKLKNNLIFITSTDTILGFLANITEKSFEKLNQIKEGRSNKPYLILITKANLNHFVDINSLDKNIQNLIDKCWPGPVTIIFKAKKDLPSYLKSEINTIALRCPNHVELQKLLTKFNGLFSTSANKTIDPPPQKINEINSEILNQIENIVDEKTNIDTTPTLDQTLPSTIIDVSNEKEIKVVREGIYSIKELEKNYGSNFKK